MNLVQTVNKLDLESAHVHLASSSLQNNWEYLITTESSRNSLYFASQTRNEENVLLCIPFMLMSGNWLTNHLSFGITMTLNMSNECKYFQENDKHRHRNKFMKQVGWQFTIYNGKDIRLNLWDTLSSGCLAKISELCDVSVSGTLVTWDILTRPGHQGLTVTAFLTEMILISTIPTIISKSLLIFSLYPPSC